MLGKRSYRGRTGRPFPAAGLRRVELLPHRERGHDLVRKVAGGTPRASRAIVAVRLALPRSGELAALTHSASPSLDRCRVGIGVSGEVVHSIRTPPRDRRQRCVLPPDFLFFFFAFLLRSHRIARGTLGSTDFYRTRDFYTRRKKQEGSRLLTRVRQPE